ncbi:MAG: F0F1 ATP synthase subunit B [Alphaproteobacteria bacterium]|nr:F0F1 ATP synthase subunit B [Alphaproteobacteria bacterium]
MISVAKATEHAKEATGHVAEEVVHGHGAFYEDSTFWVAVSFVLVIAFLYKPISRAFNTAMLVRAKKITTRLEEARKLREDTQALLAECQHKIRNSEQEAEDILLKAKADVEHLKKEAESHLDAVFAKRERQAIEHIEQAEKQSIQEIQHLAVDIFISATKTVFKEDITARQSNTIIDSAIKELPEKLAMESFH